MRESEEREKTGLLLFRTKGTDSHLQTVDCNHMGKFAFNFNARRSVQGHGMGLTHSLCDHHSLRDQGSSWNV